MNNLGEVKCFLEKKYNSLSEHNPVKIVGNLAGRVTTLVNEIPDVTKDLIIVGFCLAALAICLLNLSKGRHSSFSIMTNLIALLCIGILFSTVATCASKRALKGSDLENRMTVWGERIKDGAKKIPELYKKATDTLKKRKAEDKLVTDELYSLLINPEY